MTVRLPPGIHPANRAAALAALRTASMANVRTKDKKPRGRPRKSNWHGLVHAYLVGALCLQGHTNDQAFDMLALTQPGQRARTTNSRWSFKAFYDKFGRMVREHLRDVTAFDRLVTAGAPVPEDLARRIREFDRKMNSAGKRPR